MPSIRHDRSTSPLRPLSLSRLVCNYSTLFRHAESLHEPAWGLQASRRREEPTMNTEKTRTSIAESVRALLAGFNDGMAERIRAVESSTSRNKSLRKVTAAHPP